MVFVVVITLIDRTLNDGLQQKTRRHRWLLSFLFCANGKIRVRFFLTQGSEGLDMNHDYIKYRWPRLQENLNQSFNNYFQNVSDTSECKIIKLSHRNHTVAGKIKACVNKLINQFQKED